MTAEEQASIINAYQCGLSIIQVKDYLDGWININKENHIFDFVNNEYRIKPEEPSINTIMLRAASMYSHDYNISHPDSQIPRSILMESFIAGVKHILGTGLRLYYIYPKKSGGYDSYQGAIVVASSEDEAKDLHPSYEHESDSSCVDTYLYSKHGWTDYTLGTWASRPEYVTAMFIGYADSHYNKYDIISTEFFNG